MRLFLAGLLIAAAIAANTVFLSAVILFLQDPECAFYSMYAPYDCLGYNPKKSPPMRVPLLCGAVAVLMLGGAISILESDDV